MQAIADAPPLQRHEPADTGATHLLHLPGALPAQSPAAPGRLSTSPPATDEDLMLAVGSGSSLALEELYERHVRGCFGLAMKIVRDPYVAEEVVQDVFLKLWSQPASFLPGRGRFASWLLTLVHNRAVDKLRRARAGAGAASISLYSEDDEGVELVDILQGEDKGPSERALRSEESRIVREAVATLPRSQQLVIGLAYFEGLTQTEIADRLKEPLGTVKTRTRAALKQLRAALALAHLVTSDQ